MLEHLLASESPSETGSEESPAKLSTIFSSRFNLRHTVAPPSYASKLSTDLILDTLKQEGLLPLNPTSLGDLGTNSTQGTSCTGGESCGGDFSTLVNVRGHSRDLELCGGFRLPTFDRSNDEGGGGLSIREIWKPPPGGWTPWSTPDMSELINSHLPHGKISKGISMSSDPMSLSQGKDHNGHTREVSLHIPQSQGGDAGLTILSSPRPEDVLEKGKGAEGKVVSDFSKKPETPKRSFGKGVITIGILSLGMTIGSISLAYYLYRLLSERVSR